ncbi:MAG: hypothetical protein CSA65_01385 [Proteobacteria bacterium]|nr:MAG: hypothetical protein CSA65_01385 [Pseudomonadota bacterium]
MRWIIEDRAEFEQQLRRFELRFCCEDCSFFVPKLDRCAHFWPTKEHRRARYEAGGYEDAVFCKEFELR